MGEQNQTQDVSLSDFVFVLTWFLYIYFLITVNNFTADWQTNWAEEEALSSQKGIPCLSGENFVFSCHIRFPLCSLVGRCCPTGMWKRAGTDLMTDIPIGNRSEGHPQPVG